MPKRLSEQQLLEIIQARDETAQVNHLSRLHGISPRYIRHQVLEYRTMLRQRGDAVTIETTRDEMLKARRQFKAAKLLIVVLSLIIVALFSTGIARAPGKQTPTCTLPLQQPITPTSHAAEN